MSCVARSFFFAVLALLVSRPAAAENLLINGDFSLGNTGFTSQYVNRNVAGGYLVLSDPTQFNAAFPKIGDHTTGTGLMLVADGDTSGAFPHVWQETVNLSSGITYAFMGFAASLGQVGGSGIDASPAVLRFFVDGVQIPESSFGLNFTLPNPVGQWKEFFAFFTPVQSGSYTFSIVDINTVFVGNDFALDDLRLSSVPEPASIVMLGTGVLGLVCYGWRKVR